MPAMRIRCVSDPIALATSLGSNESEPCLKGVAMQRCPGGVLSGEQAQAAVPQRTRVERGDPIDSVEPCLKAAVATFEHHLVDAVVRDVAGDDEADRGHM